MIAASRKFVAVRLATYESASEARFLGTLFRGRSGEVENTTFAVLTPDAKPLVRSGRSPNWAFRSAADMARQMDRIGRWYERTAKSKTRTLPAAATVRLGLNLAACDQLPLLVVHAKSPKQLETLRKRAAEVAWKPALQGRLIHAATAKRADLKPLGKAPPHGFVLVRPEPYGAHGKVILTLPAGTDAKTLAAKLAAALKTYKAPKRLRDHIRIGRQLGVNWKTRVPVTDPHRPPPR